VSHSHTHSHAAGSTGRLRVVLGLTVVVLAAEVVGGLLAGSLALLADAGHLLADVGGVGLALLAASYSSRPPTAARTFGHQRAEVLAAVVNAVLLLTVGLAVIGFAVLRLLEPRTSEPFPMAVLGVLALVVNLISLRVLAEAEGLNIRGAYLEVLSDALGAAGVLVAAAVIATTGSRYADPLASLAVGLLILPRTGRLLREAVDVLLEAAPRGVDLREVREHIAATPGVLSCHDLHAWTITSGSPVLSAHVVVAGALWDDGRAGQVLDQLGECLSGHFDVEHSTFQLERPEHVLHEHALHD